MLSDDEIMHLWDTRVGEPVGSYIFTDSDKVNFARAVESAVRAEMPTGAAWISVEDRLPADGQDVIALFWPYNNRENDQCVMGAVFIADRGEFLTDTNGDTMHPPSHWAPIPATPPAEQGAGS